METYLERAECTGSRPLFVEFYDHHIPSSLMRTVRASRGMPCFVVASSGFGKTSFSVAYAKRYFGFRNVYWFDAADARFPFLLDASQLYDYLNGEILGLEEGRGLVIFDEVPLLAEPRAQALSAVVDLLIKSGWEVIVTLLPSNDSFEELQPDRLLINARRLLGTDSPGEEQQLYCVRSFFRENLPSEFRKLAAAILLLQKGSNADLAKIGVEAREDVLRFLEASYPMFGINSRRSRFDAWKIDPVALRNELLDALPKDECGDLDRACFARLIDVLVQKGCSQQAYRALRLDQEDEPLLAPRVADLVIEETPPSDSGEFRIVAADGSVLPAEVLSANELPADAPSAIETPAIILSGDGLSSGGLRIDNPLSGNPSSIGFPSDVLSPAVLPAEVLDANVLSLGSSAEDGAGLQRDFVSPIALPATADSSSAALPADAVLSAAALPADASLSAGDHGPLQAHPSFERRSGDTVESVSITTSVSLKERLAPMYVRLFGGFEVNIGDRIVGPKEWR